MDHSLDTEAFGPATTSGSVRNRLAWMFRVRPERAEGIRRAAPGELKFEEQLLNECGAMLRHASTKGLEIPPRAASIVRRLDNERADAGKGWQPKPEDAAEIVAAHRLLSRLVEPATPKSITLLNQQAPTTRWRSLFGAVFVVRVMMLLAVLFLFTFLVLLPIAGDDPIAVISGGGDRSWGESFLSAVYLLLAAGLGVLFSQLYRINRQISRGQYDPAEDAVQMTTVVLGLIAGVVMAMFMSDVLKNTDGSERFSQPLLALLGGFSAPAVHNIVSRFVDALGALVGGDPREQAAVEVQEAVTRTRATLEHEQRRLTAKAIRIGEDAANALRIADEDERRGASEVLQREVRALMSEVLTGDAEPSPVA
jgi:hypothetical protein